MVNRDKGIKYMIEAQTKRTTTIHKKNYHLLLLWSSKQYEIRRKVWEERPSGWRKISWWRGLDTNNIEQFQAHNMLYTLIEALAFLLNHKCNKHSFIIKLFVNY